MDVLARRGVAGAATRSCALSTQSQHIQQVLVDNNSEIGNMKLKRIPALVGAIVSTAPLLAAAQSSVTMFGNANGQFEAVKSSGSANPAQDKPTRTRLSNVSSDLGVRASIVVANGVKVGAQYVSGVNVDSASSAAGLWGSAKDTFVSLSVDNVGTLKLGRLSGASRWISGTPDFSPAGAGPQDNQAALSGASGQTGIGPQFNNRLDNAIGFESAAWHGMSVRAYFGTNENRSNAVVASGATLSDTSFSLGAQYVLGGLDLRAAFERRNDKGTLNNSTTNDTIDKNYRLGLRYTFPSNTTLGLGFDRMSFFDATATGSAKTYLKKTGWVVGAKQTFGQHAVYGGYGKAGNVFCVLASGAACDGSNTGMSQVVLAYNYAFNKQTLLEAFFSQVSNQERARYDFDSGGIGIGTGAKATAVGFGVRYSF
jgi:predicted porin